MSIHPEATAVKKYPDVTAVDTDVKKHPDDTTVQEDPGDTVRVRRFSDVLGVEEHVDDTIVRVEEHPGVTTVEQQRTNSTVVHLTDAHTVAV